MLHAKRLGLAVAVLALTPAVVVAAAGPRFLPAMALIMGLPAAGLALAGWALADLSKVSRRIAFGLGLTLPALMAAYLFQIWIPVLGEVDLAWTTYASPLVHLLVAGAALSWSATLASRVLPWLRASLALPVLLFLYEGGPYLIGMGIARSAGRGIEVMDIIGIILMAMQALAYALLALAHYGVPPEDRDEPVAAPN